MLINNEWSVPQPIEYGKNVRVRCSEDGLQIRVYNASGEALVKPLPEFFHELLISKDEIANIYPQMISFKTVERETHVEYELF